MASVNKNGWVWAAALVIIAGGVLFGLLHNPAGPAPDRFAETAPPVGPTGLQPAVVPLNAPVVVGFKGDLADGGYLRKDGTVIPFVAGEILKLEADAQNATEYRWVVNGEVVKEKNDEWSPLLTRLYTVAQPGEYRFKVQVRGADPALLSQPKEKTLKIVPLFIESFEPSIIEPDEDRRLTGAEYSLDVTMAEPTPADNDFYKYRYLVNDQPTRHPDVEDEDAEEGEWCTETDFRYTFPAPGTYSFKVEARRATVKEIEGFKELEVPIIVADAIASTFDTFPEKYAPLGTTVTLSTFNESVLGSSDCRFGVKKITAADFEWLTDKDGAIWGTSERDWLPREPGNYILRVEVRQTGKQQADDFRELRYTITEGDF